MSSDKKADVSKKRFDFSTDGLLYYSYRVIAVNKAGEGEPSSTEMVVL